MVNEQRGGYEDGNSQKDLRQKMHNLSNRKTRNAIALALTLTLGLVGCASKYQPLTSNTKSNQAGYKEDRLNQGEEPARYALRYQGNTSDNKEKIFEFWHRRAGELCTSGYDIISFSTRVRHGQFKSPVNGISQTFYTQQFISLGEVVCK